MSIRLTPGVLLALAASGLLPLGTTYAASNSCYWGAGTGPILYTANVGALYVPRDAQIGDPIGPREKTFNASGEQQRLAFALE